MDLSRYGSSECCLSLYMESIVAINIWSQASNMGRRCQHDLWSVCRSWMACSAPSTAFSLLQFSPLFSIDEKLIRWTNESVVYLQLTRTNTAVILKHISEALWCVLSLYGICCFMVPYFLLLWLLSVWLLAFAVFCMSLVAYWWKCKLKKKKINSSAGRLTCSSITT